MDPRLTTWVAQRTGLEPNRVAGCIRLLSEGNTVPFIARYRKEMTGTMDEVGIRRVEEEYRELEAVLERQQTILATLEKLDKLTPELRRQIEECLDRQRLEDLYLPFKPRRATRADKAREAGLEPLAATMVGGSEGIAEARVAVQPALLPRRRLEWAQRFINPDKAIVDVQAALAGARDIVADWMATVPETRAAVREMGGRMGQIVSKKKRGASEEAEAFRDYFEHAESVSRAAPHRILAMLRGEEAGALSIDIEVNGETGEALMLRPWERRVHPAFREDVLAAVADGWSRLLWPAVSREILGQLKKRADVASVTVFENNLRSVLMEPPARGKVVLGFDPGFRNGCKMAAVDATGKVLGTATIYPHEPQKQVKEATALLLRLASGLRLAVIAVGDGTAHRESMTFLESVPWERPMEIVAVSEAGASVYSASPIAGQEFPDMDVSLRGAVCIARRYQDPLAELVKIEPKALGLGQYQHDVDQKLLESGLDAVVEECVNRVGVELNTASAPLLARVAGLTATSANAVVSHRNQKGAFPSREALLKVSGIGPARFLQAAGFLRIRDGAKLLDATGIHPERYEFVEALMAAAGLPLKQVLGNPQAQPALRAAAKAIAGRFPDVGQATLGDILSDLEKPGHDPRGERVAFRFADGITSIEHLVVGQVLPGRVTNVTDFGAFVDIGVHRDGLVHISQLANRRVASAFEVVQPRQAVMVRVVEVDLKRGRIGLSMRDV